MNIILGFVQDVRRIKVHKRRSQCGYIRRHWLSTLKGTDGCLLFLFVFVVVINVLFCCDVFIYLFVPTGMFTSCSMVHYVYLKLPSLFQK